MIIQKVKFTDNKNDGVIITFEDDSTFQIPTQKNRYQYTDLFKEWLEAGNKIEAFKSASEILKDSKNKKTDEINQACEKAMVSGFKSKSLGEWHFYYSTIAEQSTLNSLINLGVSNNFKAQKINIVDEKEVKEERIQHLHTLGQLKEVLKDGAIHIATQVTKKDLLEEQIKAASTVEEIEAISWE